MKKLLGMMDMFITLMEEAILWSDVSNSQKCLLYKSATSSRSVIFKFFLKSGLTQRETVRCTKEVSMDI